MKRSQSFIAALAMLMSLVAAVPVWAKAPLVLFTDFGTRDGALSAMKGVAYGVSQDLLISDLSHDYPGSLFAGAYRLWQVAPFWPKGTVFVTVIDPGVGTQRLAVALKTKAGHYYIAPNNGLLTLVAETEGVEDFRQIDESVNRRPGSEDSYTFHGRDVFGFVGAKLAAGTITFEQIGPRVPVTALTSIAYTRPSVKGRTVRGIIPVLDVEYGNVWSNIPKPMFDQLGIKIGDKVRVRIYHGGALVDELTAPYQHTFGEVPEGQPLVYINSLMSVAIALNLGSYAEAHKIESGVDWFIEVEKA
jgi:S-adenosylmethionine hydrolase